MSQQSTSTKTKELLPLEKVRTDGGTQPRAQLDGVTVTEYADAMRRGDEFPPVNVMHDGENYWLYDGFHRVQAARQIGREEIVADVEQGTRQEAIWKSASANKRHGLRRDDEDKRQAVETALLHEKGTGCSDNQIAKHCGVSQPFVGQVRRDLEDDSTYNVISQTERTGADGRTIDTSNIGGSGENNSEPNQPDDLLDTASKDNGGTPTPQRKEKREERKDEYRDRKEIEPFPKEGEYGVIYADPPWQYNNSGLDEYGHAERHYDTMGIDGLCELPVHRIAGEDCALYLWTTSPMLEDAFDVLSSWGFDYKTSYVWDKIAHNHGHYNSVRHELLLIATQGDGTPDRQKLYDSVVSIRRGEHSKKPPYFRRLLDVLYEQRQKIELFAREAPSADRWDAWGDEV